ncbi:hypothetical protein [Microterricola viridarii]|uniref:hypothetical protein n=1 Tax=Microterricola viridarii TaxID=412690 RepID=UPI0019015E04|nr:hypothetical protein [Microterricola viridarii]
MNLIARGHMMNLAGPGALGNSIDAMDIGFALQARCLELIAGGGLDARSAVVPVPRAIDEAVANQFVAAATGAEALAGWEAAALVSAESAPGR